MKGVLGWRLLVWLLVVIGWVEIDGEGRNLATTGWLGLSIYLVEVLEVELVYEIWEDALKIGFVN